MADKVIVVGDPGIDAAFAIALALNDPGLEVLAIAATAGNVPAEQATRNMHIVVEQIDPPRWPRIGTALPIEYESTGVALHGSDGLGGLDFPCVRLHHALLSDKLISDTIRQYPNEVTIVQTGPLTALARALDRDPDLARLIHRIILVGGCWREPGDISAAAEFHFWSDPEAARQVVRCAAPITLLPLDVTRKLVFSPGDIRQIAAGDTRTATFLGKILPTLLVPTAGLYGIEGVTLNDALAIAALARPTAFALQPTAVDVETRGELTRGMSVFDVRWSTSARPNLDVVTSVDIGVVRQYIAQTLAESMA